MGQNHNSAKNLKPFVKGDVRINRKGRPKTFDKLRELAQVISHEFATDANGNLILAPDGHALTVAEAMLRSMVLDRKHRRLFLEIAFGKVPDELVVHGDPNAAIPIAFVDYRKDITEDDKQEEEREE